MLGVFFLSFPTAAAVALAPGFFSVGAMICVGEREREREREREGGKERGEDGWMRR